MSVILAFIQEYRAGREAEQLSEMIRATATVYRQGRIRDIKIREIVPGDIIYLAAGDMVPADIRLLSCKDLFVNEASLTGESFPIEKSAEPVHPRSAALSELTNCVFMGSSVVTGTATGLAVQTGLATRFGELSRRLVTGRGETRFDRGVKEFTWLMVRAMSVMVVVIFAINVLGRHRMVDAFLFSLSVAVGLTPEMLPMIVTINLSRGAIAMARKKVIVKRLSSIQTLGAMDILCMDKTGTLTLDKVVLERYCDVTGQEDTSVLLLAYINSFYQTGLKNLLDQAILKHSRLPVRKYRKIDELPFDFSRKLMSVVVEQDGEHLLVTKGAPEEVFKRCTHYELDSEIEPMEPLLIADLQAEYRALSSQGFRVLAVAYRKL
ncbi:MAG TPA: HAD-IC family P-type ATPase, partial [bacterium]|nr:HAD-IC family P-type ATPase [bacterium]